MSSATSILARRRGGDVLIADEPCRVRCRWPGLRSSDDAEIAVEWQASVVCVDSPADRALLAEQLMTDAASVTADSVASRLVEAGTPTLRRAIEAEDAAALLSGNSDAAIAALVEGQARRAAFAAGLAIVPPLTLRISSPSRERDRRVAEVRSKLDAMRGDDGDRAKSIGALTQLFAERGDARRTSRMIADLRLNDPLDLLRAAALAEPSWAATTPRLWIVAGSKMTSAEATRGTLDASAITLDAVGPLRSVREATIDDVSVLLVGARDGVIAVERDTGRVLRTFHDSTGSEFGFNAACYLTESRTIAATHSLRGVVTWNWDNADARPTAVTVPAARSVTSIDGARAVFVADGRVALFTEGGVVTTSLAAAEVTAAESGVALVWDDDGTTSLLNASELEHAEGGLRTSTRADIVAAAPVDVCGVPRAIVALKSGGLNLLDFAGGDSIPIGPPRLFARTLRTRPGFVAAVNADRTRIHLLDLARPEVVASELNVSALLGNRVADVTFA